MQEVGYCHSYRQQPLDFNGRWRTARDTKEVKFIEFTSIGKRVDLRPLVAVSLSGRPSTSRRLFIHRMAFRLLRLRTSADALNPADAASAIYEPCDTENEKHNPASAAPHV